MSHKWPSSALYFHYPVLEKLKVTQEISASFFLERAPVGTEALEGPLSGVVVM